MTEEGKNAGAYAWVWGTLILLLAVVAYFFLHAWLVNGVDQPDPHPLTVIAGHAATPAPQLPERKTLDRQAAPYS
ncbi:hypothetical protein [Acidithiobacillus sp. AMEEHan]|uniref:hypothetical protein n=1 Tax=Acidithiobacillus sp. AMEEHan TaxID=2994951 RepID=UPI0027E5B127|nr:hypothetical protein [Acidithiobacillus sp. AMEEHan]